MKHEWAVSSNGCNDEAGIQEPKFWVASMVSGWRGHGLQKKGFLLSLATNLRGSQEQVT